MAKEGTCWEQQIPDGFSPLVIHPNSKREVQVGVLVLSNYHIGGYALSFRVPASLELIPELPIKTGGLFWHNGWDIPTRWIVDSADNCWKDDAHGGHLEHVSPKELIDECPTEELRREMQKQLGQPVTRPTWVSMALAAGWKPPEGWVDQ